MRRLRRAGTRLLINQHRSTFVALVAFSGASRHSALLHFSSCVCRSELRTWRAGYCRWRRTRAHHSSRPHLAGSHHSAATHHGARARLSTRTHLACVAPPVRPAIATPVSAQEEPRKENQSDDEHDAGNDADCCRNLAQPTKPLIVVVMRGLFSCAGRFARRSGWFGHILNNVAQVSVKVGTIGPNDSGEVGRSTLVAWTTLHGKSICPSSTSGRIVVKGHRQSGSIPNKKACSTL